MKTATSCELDVVVIFGDALKFKAHTHHRTHLALSGSRCGAAASAGQRVWGVIAVGYGANLRIDIQALIQIVHTADDRQCGIGILIVIGHFVDANRHYCLPASVRAEYRPMACSQALRAADYLNLKTDLHTG